MPAGHNARHSAAVMAAAGPGRSWRAGLPQPHANRRRARSSPDRSGQGAAPLGRRGAWRGSSAAAAHLVPVGGFGAVLLHVVDLAAQQAARGPGVDPVRLRRVASLNTHLAAGGRRVRKRGARRGAAGAGAPGRARRCPSALSRPLPGRPGTCPTPCTPPGTDQLRKHGVCGQRVARNKSEGLRLDAEDMERIAPRRRDRRSLGDCVLSRVWRARRNCPYTAKSKSTPSVE